MPHQISDLFHDLGDFQHFIRMQSVHGRPDAVKGIRFFCRCVGIDIQQLMQRNFQAACDLVERLNGGAFFTTFHLADIGWVSDAKASSSWLRCCSVRNLRIRSPVMPDMVSRFSFIEQHRSFRYAGAFRIPHASVSYWMPQTVQRGRWDNP